MIDIFEVFSNVIKHNRSVDMADSEFKRLLLDDNEIRKAYKEWCEHEGYTEKKGFIEYCHSVFDEEENKWDVLNNENEYF